MGSAGSTPGDEDEEEEEVERVRETGRAVRQENFTHQTQPNRETKKEA